MSADGHISNIVQPVTDVVDDAVGVEKSYWFVAIVNHNSEKRSSEKLNNMNIENYLPTQTELRVWRNGRKAKVDRIVIPSIIFVYCTEQKRKGIVGLHVRLNFIYHSEKHEFYILLIAVKIFILAFILQDCFGSSIPLNMIIEYDRLKRL